jgi:hypothetical protein
MTRDDDIHEISYASLSFLSDPPQLVEYATSLAGCNELAEIR